MALTLAKSDARRMLAHHHFAPTTLTGAFERLGSVQFDPLNPVGRNHDLVLQARVPGYRVDDWQALAYRDRYLLDAWDKQASLVRMRDWAVRRVYHSWHAEHWRAKVLKPNAKAVQTVLAELEDRGPLTGAGFEFQPHRHDWEGSWYGPKLTKNILRGLWHTGRVVTHSRKNGHHVYDLSERVVPPELLGAPAVSSLESAEWLIKLRHQAVGLLRPNASTEVWSLGISATERKALIKTLVDRKELVEIEVEGVQFHALPETLQRLESAPRLPSRMIFVAPLDQLIWDRKATAHLYDFDYIWEVYKPEQKRTWGYYVLPVFYGDSFVGRFDSRFKNGVWDLKRWYWEKDSVPDAAMLTALENAVRDFKLYLGAEKVLLPRGLDKGTRAAWRSA